MRYPGHRGRVWDRPSPSLENKSFHLKWRVLVYVEFWCILTDRQSPSRL